MGPTLQHFGVLGMKWGVRKDRDSSGTKGSEEYRSARAMKAKGVQNLSTAELKTLTNRLQLEKQFKELDPSDIQKGLKVVKSITAAGTTIASLYALTKTPLGQDVIKAIKGRVS